MEPSRWSGYRGSYEGPGIYRHYKGGHYRVLGVSEPEPGGPAVVVYHGYSLPDELARYAVGVDFVHRQLHGAPGVDAFNDLVTVNGALCARFEKVYAA